MKSKGILAMGAFAGATLFTAAACVSHMVVMPGTSYRAAPGFAAPALVDALRSDVTALAIDIGERHIVGRPAELKRAQEFIASRLVSLGYAVSLEPFEVKTQASLVSVEQRTVHNIIVERAGNDATKDIVVVGAHYDSAEGTPGADDNASGVAANLALAAAFAHQSPRKTIRFVFFTNEEPPFFNTRDMGSEVNAKAARTRGDNIIAMLSLETMGYYQDGKNSQAYPWPMSLAYPTTGNFVLFVGNLDSRNLVRESVRLFRMNAQIPSEGGAVPASVEGVDWSDHGPFWRQGYKALMVTDSALFRNPSYHKKTDLPATLDFNRLGLVVEGLVPVVKSLANGP
jgi:Zn-dependent M28 family amino/carboxypeptidase